eukprot:766334-Hanusia_phi.AAC.7
MTSKMTAGAGNLAPFLIAGLYSGSNTFQSTSSRSVLNNISLNFAFRNAFEYPSVLLVSNFSGASWSSNSLALSDRSTDATCISSKCNLHFCNSAGTPGFGEWDNSKKELYLFVCNRTIGNLTYRLSLTIQNPSTGQTAPTLSINAYQRVTGETIVARVALNSATYLNAPLAIFGYKIANIGQSDANRNVKNTLTVTLQIYNTFGVTYPFANITLKNLLGASTSKNVDLFSSTLCGSTTCNALFSDAANNSGKADWANSSFSLSLSVNRIIFSDYVMIFSFNVYNPPLGQSSPPVAIVTAGYNYFDELSMGKGPGNLAPLLICNFDIKKIGQSTDQQSSRNNITITLQSNVILQAQNTSITIIGLTGSTTPDTPSLPLHFLYSGNSSGFSQSGFWNSSSGTLQIQLLKVLEANVSYIFYFELLNPPTAQDSPPVFVVANGPLTIPKDLMESAPTIKAPLKVSGISEAFISQETPIALSFNQLTLQFATTTDFYESDNSTVLIEGLGYYESYPVQAYPFVTVSTKLGSSSSNSNVFCYGKWQIKNNANYLALFLCSGQKIEKNVLHTVTISVHNPGFDQVLNPVRIAFFGTTFLDYQNLTRPGKTVFGILNFTDPPLVVYPSFRSRLRQVTPVSGEPNTITVSLKPNVNLASSDQSRITISNLVSAIIPTTVSLNNVSGVDQGPEIFGGSGTFQGESLILTVAAGQTLRAE